MQKRQNPGPGRDPSQSGIFLEKWEAQAGARRERLTQAIAEAPKNPRRALLRQDWLRKTQQHLAIRKEWLAARLQHINAVEKIVAAAIKRQETP